MVEGALKRQASDAPFKIETRKNYLKLAREKRKYKRLDFQKLVHIFFDLPATREAVPEVRNNSIFVWAINISEGGMLIESVHPLDLNFNLKIIFEFEENFPMEMDGKIAWQFDNQCGIRF